MVCCIPRLFLIGLFLVTAVTARAVTPMVTTTVATAVMDTNAVFNGTVDPMGGAFQVQAEYGLTQSYGYISSNFHKNYFIGTGVQACDFKTSFLLPNTTYHFRIVATTLDGASKYVGNDMTFTTLASPPVVVTTAATGVTDLTAILNGTVTTNGALMNVAFEYGLSTNEYYEVASTSGMNNSSAASVSLQLQGLLPARTYHYRVKAKYDDDPSLVIYGQDMNFTTGPAATPPTVGGIYAYILTTSVWLGCERVFRGSSPITSVYEYGLTSDYGSSVTIQGYPNAALSGLTPGTTYHVRCVVTNGEGSAATPDFTFTTATPSTVITRSASSVGDLSAVFNGFADPNGSNVTGETAFEYGTTTAYGTLVDVRPYFSSEATEFSANVTGLLPATTYHYRAKVRYNADLYYGQDMTFTTAAARTPPSVSITSITPNITTAKVNCAAFAGSSEAASFFCEYQAPGGPLQTTTFSNTLALGTSVPVSILLTQLQPSTTYTCRCGVTNAQGTSYTDYATFTTLAGAILTTTAATSVADLSVVLNGSANPNSSYRYGIDFELGTTTQYDKVFTPASGNIATGTTATAFTAMATRLLPNTTYHYRLRAAQYEGSGYNTTFLGYQYGADQTFTTGAPATPPSVLTQSAHASAPTAGGLFVGFETGSSPATVVAEYGTTTAYGSQDTSPITFDASIGTNMTCVLSGLTPNTTYHCRVTVTNGEGSSTGQDVTFTTLSPPTVITNVAGSVSATSAYLSGTYHMQNGNYSVSIEYGQTTAYGQTATPGQLYLGGLPVIVVVGPPVTNATQYYSVNQFSLLPQTTYHYRLKLTDYYGTSYYGDDVTFTTVSPVQVWRQQRFSTIQDAGSAADMACPAGDGVPNLLKYALNMDPARAGTPPQPQVRDYDGAQHLSLTFQRDPAKTDITYEVQAADNPTGPWTTLATSVGGAAASGPGLVQEGFSLVLTFPWELGPWGPLSPVSVDPAGYPFPVSVEVKDTVSTQDAPRRFMRLQVTRQ